MKFNILTNEKVVTWIHFSRHCADSLMLLLPHGKSEYFIFFTVPCHEYIRIDYDVTIKKDVKDLFQMTELINCSWFAKIKI